MSSLKGTFSVSFPLLGSLMATLVNLKSSQSYHITILVGLIRPHKFIGNSPNQVGLNLSAIRSRSRWGDSTRRWSP